MLLRLRQWIAVVVAVGSAACGGFCPSVEPLNNAMGEQLRCIVSTDCPRPSNVLVCAQGNDMLQDCVACERAFCVRYRPKACQ
jgi:hypothetical protein